MSWHCRGVSAHSCKSWSSFLPPTTSLNHTRSTLCRPAYLKSAKRVTIRRRGFLLNWVPLIQGGADKFYQVVGSIDHHLTPPNVINHFARHRRILTIGRIATRLLKDSFFNLRRTFGGVLDRYASLTLLSNVAVAGGASNSDTIRVVLLQYLAQLL